MTALAPLLEAFFTERLIGQLDASPHTVSSYRDSFRLLLRFAHQRTGRAPHKLALEDLDATLIGAFLNHLEAERAASVRTRNARLTAVRSLFNFAAYRHPEHAALIQRVLAIPPKRTDKAVVTYLTEDEAAALLGAPDRSTRIGRRDHALLLLAQETGLRVSEITGLTCADVRLGAGAHVRAMARGARSASHRSGARHGRSCSVGLTSAVGPPATPSSLGRRATGSVAMPSVASSIAMSPPRPGRALRSHPRRSRRTP